MAFPFWACFYDTQFDRRTKGLLSIPACVCRDAKSDVVLGSRDIRNGEADDKADMSAGIGGKDQ